VELIANFCVCFQVMSERLMHIHVGQILGSKIAQWFPKCAPHIPTDPRSVPRGSVKIFL
jgi:hypothetical protein